MATQSRADALLVVAHGSREAAANDEVARFVERLRGRSEAFDVELCFVELASPSVDQALQSLGDEYRRVVLAPLFLFASGHVKNDLPLSVARAAQTYPGVRYDVALPLGTHPGMARLIVDRVGALIAGGGAGAASGHVALPADAALLVVGRGSSDAESNADFCKLVRLAGERLGTDRCAAAFMGICGPAVQQALEQLSRSRPSAIYVVPYLLTGGVLLRRLADTCQAFARDYPWIPIQQTRHLGLDEGIHAVLVERAEETLAGRAALPCTGCQYRPAAGEIASRVDGMRALLYSLRHATTHTRAMPHEHAHAAVSRHVLICGNADCADRGSLRLLGALRRGLREAGQERAIKVTRTSCMGRCGEGPTVVVYPDGVWYRNVCAEDAPLLLEQHLNNNQIIAHLVDSIMQ